MQAKRLKSLLYRFFDILTLSVTSFFVVIYGVLILLARTILTLLVGLRPLFIVALLWQPTYRLFLIMDSANLKLYNSYYAFSHRV
ncbi:sensor histidine kinase YesM [Bartonella silvatica]|uniref:Sensor histidine kinase YesM n=1 Tax=Bartonella silvatica TaxID=357760 RepID=A0ABV2HFJ7_9HYPH